MTSWMLSARSLGVCSSEPKPSPLLAVARLDELLQAGERTPHDEEDVRRVDLDELLVRVLAAPLRRHGGGRALEDLEEGLLHPLAGDVAGDRRVLALAGDLVDLVDVDDARLGLLDVVVGSLDELEEDVLDVLADVAGLGQGRRVGDREGDVEHLRQRLGEIGLATAGRADEEDVGLGDVDVVGVLLADRGLTRLDALVVVVDRDGERLLRDVLADDVLLEEVEDLARLGELVEPQLARLRELLLDDLVAEVDALVADVDTRAGDELLDLLLRLATEGALQQIAGLAHACHGCTFPRLEQRPRRYPPVSSTAPIEARTRLARRPCPLSAQRRSGHRRGPTEMRTFPDAPHHVGPRRWSDGAIARGYRSGRPSREPASDTGRDRTRGPAMTPSRSASRWRLQPRRPWPP